MKKVKPKRKVESEFGFYGDSSGKKSLQGFELTYTWLDSSIERDKCVFMNTRQHIVFSNELEELIKKYKLHKFFESVKIDFTGMDEEYLKRKK